MCVPPQEDTHCLPHMRGYWLGLSGTIQGPQRHKPTLNWKLLEQNYMPTMSVTTVWYGLSGRKDVLILKVQVKGIIIVEITGD